MNSQQFAEVVKRAKLPGAAAVIVNSEGAIESHATGFANVESGAPMGPDTLCQIASMTKALVSVAAMQLVERGKLSLDAPIGEVLPDLASPQVLTGFNADGRPQTRDALRPMTLRHLLTHTSGFGYAFVQKSVLDFFLATGMPTPGSRQGIEMPLLFDPGEYWAYGVSTDWVGLAVEAASGQRLRDYLHENVTGLLGMERTDFFDQPPEGLAAVHARLPEGGFAQVPAYIGGGEYDNAGGGLVSTANDYAKFLQAMLRGGELDGARILSPESFAEMTRNQVGTLRAGRMETTMPELTNIFDAFPDQHTGWGLGFLINPEQGSAGRAPGSLAWAGIFNSYYWIDPASDLAGVFVTQLSPFGDPRAMEAFAAVERAAYA